MAQAISGWRARRYRCDTQYRIAGRACSKKVLPSIADRKAFICMDKSINYSDLDEMSRALAAYLQSKGLQEGCPRRADDAERDAISDRRPSAVLRAGYAVVNVNPLYTPRELEHQLKDSGAEAVIVLENFAITVRAGDRPHRMSSTSSSAVWATCSGFKGMIVNLVVRRVKKMVPAYSLPDAVTFNDATRGRPRHEAQQAEARTRRCRLPAIYRGHHRRSPKARRCFIAISSSNVLAERCVAATGAEEAAACRPAVSSSVRCRSITSSR